MTKLLTGSVLAISTLVGSHAVATTYQYTDAANRFGVEDATFTYQDTTDDFELSFDSAADAGVDGFWLVMNDGPQPYFEGQGHLAILYSDLTDIWAYQYTGSGVRGVNASYNGTFIERFENAVTTTTSGGTTSVNVSMNLSGVNSANLTADWVGAAFGSTIGTWLHTTRNTFDGCATYTSGDELTCFSGSDWLGWDRANQDTIIVGDLTPVPLPAGLPLLASALGLFAFGRRLKKQA